MDALLIKIPEAAAPLGISRAKLYELLAAGALPSVKVDGCQRIRTAELLEFVARLEATVGVLARADPHRDPRIECPIPPR